MRVEGVVIDYVPQYPLPRTVWSIVVRIATPGKVLRQVGGREFRPDVSQVRLNHRLIHERRIDLRR